MPRKRNPRSCSAKWNRSRMRAWVSELRYIRVLRQVKRSIREIGASWIRSWRPKITERRRSLLKVYRPLFTSKYFSSNAAGTPWTSLGP